MEPSPVGDHAATVMKTGGQILAECLVAHGVDTAFCVPGESFLAVLDGLYEVQDRLRVIVGRHEASTASMAEAYGKLTGKPGICFVTRGPGASHAAIALHTAWQDSTPMILFVGQVAREQRGREAFQEMDYRDAFGRTAKWVVEISDAARAVELIGHAFHVATNGRPGPVVVSIPEDMQVDLAEYRAPAPYRLASAAPSAAALSEIQSLVETAERPLVILGGGGWSQSVTDDVRRFAEAFDLPVVNGFRRQDLFDNTHPNYGGFLGFGVSPALAEQVGEADLLLVVGERLGDTTTTGYTLIDFPRPRQKLVHVHSGPEELGALYEGDLLVAATSRDFAAAVAGLTPSAPASAARRAWRERAHANYLAFSTPPAISPQKIDVPRIVDELSRRLPPNATITNGAGTYTGYVHRYYKYRDFGSQLAPTSGAMGYGLPAALAAKVAHPDRPAVCFAGDGCFLMASQELATAIRHDLPVIVVVIDNACYGSIRVHQERHFPGRVFATDLANPDFVALAQAYGAHAEAIDETDDFAAAFDRAVASRRPALITFRIDIEKVVAFNPRTA